MQTQLMSEANLFHPRQAEGRAPKAGLTAKTAAVCAARRPLQAARLHVPPVRVEAHFRVVNIQRLRTLCNCAHP